MNHTVVHIKEKLGKPFSKTYSVSIIILGRD